MRLEVMNRIRIAARTLARKQTPAPRRTELSPARPRCRHACAGSGPILGPAALSPLRLDLHAAAATARLAIAVIKCERYSALPGISLFNCSGGVLILAIASGA